MPVMSVAWQFSLTNLRGMIIAVILYVMAWIMEEARKLKDDQDYTV